MIITKQTGSSLKITLDSGITTYASDLEDVSTALMELALSIQCQKYKYEL